ncbi:hypothetical protein PTSG_09374 [Salpingoeca rosetta]|uniref:Uncharacterized protein n=1 Tax=Salpingoeca rosetta (strain ATCC 50818 / BSB-021) TaxID=946362 RepID=F2UMF8_SALR5|nr:uncharacterized protein PTSG_09374 [Salpingoeca rosetta]EGD78307.1 hypothetical protein PTSG_09374 [Salpingoeca rosetta]|eukprot:XP_004989630.1 hypothetical protein PTSG_09374 [Salpingoeca rosetta]
MCVQEQQHPETAAPATPTMGDERIRSSTDEAASPSHSRSRRQSQAMPRVRASVDLSAAGFSDESSASRSTSRRNSSLFPSTQAATCPKPASFFHPAPGAARRRSGHRRNKSSDLTIELMRSTQGGIHNSSGNSNSSSTYRRHPDDHSPHDSSEFGALDGGKRFAYSMQNLSKLTSPSSPLLRRRSSGVPAPPTKSLLELSKSIDGLSKLLQEPGPAAPPPPAPSRRRRSSLRPLSDAVLYVDTGDDVDDNETLNIATSEQFSKYNKLPGVPSRSRRRSSQVPDAMEIDSRLVLGPIGTNDHKLPEWVEEHMRDMSMSPSQMQIAQERLLAQAAGEDKFTHTHPDDADNDDDDDDDGDDEIGPDLAFTFNSADFHPDDSDVDDDFFGDGDDEDDGHDSVGNGTRFEAAEGQALVDRGVSPTFVARANKMRQTARQARVSLSRTYNLSAPDRMSAHAWGDGQGLADGDDDRDHAAHSTTRRDNVGDSDNDDGDEDGAVDGSYPRDDGSSGSDRDDAVSDMYGEEVGMDCPHPRRRAQFGLVPTHSSSDNDSSDNDGDENGGGDGDGGNSSGGAGHDGLRDGRDGACGDDAQGRAVDSSGDASHVNLRSETSERMLSSRPMGPPHKRGGGVLASNGPHVRVDSFEDSSTEDAKENAEEDGDSDKPDESKHGALSAEVSDTSARLWGNQEQETHGMQEEGHHHHFQDQQQRDQQQHTRVMRDCDDARRGRSGNLSSNAAHYSPNLTRTPASTALKKGASFASVNLLTPASPSASPATSRSLTSRATASVSPTATANSVSPSSSSPRPPSSPTSTPHFRRRSFQFGADSQHK